MGLRDLKNNLSVNRSIAPGTKTGTVQGDAIDLQGAKSVMVVFDPGANSAGTWTPTVEESDSAVASPDSFTTVAADDLEGSLSAIVADEIQKVGYKGTKRHIRAVLTTATSPASLVAAAQVIVEPLAKPAA